MNNKIKIGTFVKNYPVNKLIYSTLNRDIVEKHSDSFKNKVVEFGWLVPIIIDHKGYVLEGHHRIEMAIKLGLKTLPSYIIDWVDTTNKDEYQKYVMTINNNNRKWSALDYLKSYKQTRKDYSYVFNKYTNSDGLFTVGNVLNIYFNSGCNATFKKGNSEIKRRVFSEYLYDKFYDLRKNYGKVKIQSFTINRVCAIAHQITKGNQKEMEYIFTQLETWAEQDNPILSSVEHIRPEIKKQINVYREHFK